MNTTSASGQQIPKSTLSDMSDSFNSIGKVENNYFPANGETNYMLDLQKNQCVDMYGNQYALQNNNITSMYPDYSQPASLEFDGQNLIWLQNGQPIKYYSAMSGKPNHQTARDMSIPDEGPIPEGRYILPGNSGEHHEPGEWRTFDEFISNVWLSLPIFYLGILMCHEYL